MPAPAGPLSLWRRPPPDRAARYLLYSAVFWLIVPMFAGLAMAIFLYEPHAQELTPEALKPYLSFGRLRPMHVNVAIYGWVSMVWAGSMLYLTPRLCATRLFSERLAWATMALWNVMILGTAVSLPLGFTQAREYAEMVWPLDLIFLALFAMLAVNVWGTVRRRREKRIYISLWSFMAATVIAPVVFAVGHKVWDPSGAYEGVNDAIINYFFVHNIFNIWFTTVGIGLAFYLVPKLSGNPLYSHRLAIWGFSSVWTGQHHLLYSPGPEWLEILSVSFSILAAIPNTAFLFNILMTMRGRWHVLRESVALRFLIAGSFFYVMTCVQGILQSFRSFNAYTHFTQWVIGHSHLAFVADYSFFGIALVYALIPRMLGRPMRSAALMRWHFWLSLFGVSVMLVDLWLAGLVQAQDWASGMVPFIETVQALKPYMGIRALAGAVLILAQLLFAWNLVQTARRPRAAARAPAGPIGIPA
jgi:cbb3-type cytochrome c oxidase subunit I